MAQKLTHFQCVGEFHEVFDYPVRTEEYDDVFEEDPKLLRSRVAFLREERDEFVEAYRTNDVVEMADALCDLLYFAYGTGQCLGLILDYSPDNDMSVTPDDLDTNVPKDIAQTETDVIGIKLEMINVYIDSIEEQMTGSNMRQIRHFLELLIDKTYELGYALHFDMDAMFREVHRSNMTKVCTTREDAEESVRRYKEAGTYAKPVVRTKGDYFLVYDEELNKILKYYKWEEPQLAQFMGSEFE